MIAKKAGKAPSKSLTQFDTRKLDEKFANTRTRADEVELDDYFTKEFQKTNTIFANKHAKQTLKDAIIMFPEDSLINSLPVTLWCLEHMIRLSRNIKSKNNRRKMASDDE